MAPTAKSPSAHTRESGRLGPVFYYYMAAWEDETQPRVSRAVRLLNGDGVQATPSGASSPAEEGCMSACTVWELVLTVAVVVCAGLAWHYRNEASRLKTRARSYLRYVP